MEVSEVPAALAIEAAASAIEAAVASAALLVEAAVSATEAAVASAVLLVEAVASVAAHTVVVVSALVEEEDKIHFLTHETSSQSYKAAIERFPPFFWSFGK